MRLPRDFRFHRGQTNLQAVFALENQIQLFGVAQSVLLDIRHKNIVGIKTFLTAKGFLTIWTGARGGRSANGAMIRISHVFYEAEQRFFEYDGLYVRLKDVKVIENKYRHTNAYVARIYTDGVPLGTFKTDKYHLVVISECETERLECYMCGRNDPVAELVDELRYHPEAGSYMGEARKRFCDNANELEKCWE